MSTENDFPREKCPDCQQFTCEQKNNFDFVRPVSMFQCALCFKQFVFRRSTSRIPSTPMTDEVVSLAIDQSIKNTGDAWKNMALQALRQICLENDTFTVNDVRELVKKSPLKTHDNRAMGGIIKIGQRQGWFAPTGQSIPSVVGHKVHIQIWKSKISCQKKLFQEEK